MGFNERNEHAAWAVVSGLLWARVLYRYFLWHFVTTQDFILYSQSCHSVHAHRYIVLLKKKKVSFILDRIYLHLVGTRKSDEGRKIFLLWLGKNTHQKIWRQRNAFSSSSSYRWIVCIPTIGMRAFVLTMIWKISQGWRKVFSYYG